MKEDDNIDSLFKDQLGNLKPEVPDALWGKISSQIAEEPVKTKGGFLWGWITLAVLVVVSTGYAVIHFNKYTVSTEQMPLAGKTDRKTQPTNSGTPSGQEVKLTDAYVPVADVPKKQELAQTAKIPLQQGTPGTKERKIKKRGPKPSPNGGPQQQFRSSANQEALVSPTEAAQEPVRPRYLLEVIAVKTRQIFTATAPVANPKLPKNYKRYPVYTVNVYSGLGTFAIYKPTSLFNDFSKQNSSVSLNQPMGIAFGIKPNHLWEFSVGVDRLLWNASWMGTKERTEMSLYTHQVGVIQNPWGPPTPVYKTDTLFTSVTDTLNLYNEYNAYSVPLKARINKSLGRVTLSPAAGINVLVKQRSVQEMELNKEGVIVTKNSSNIKGKVVAPLIGVDFKIAYTLFPGMEVYTEPGFILTTGALKDNNVFRSEQFLTPRLNVGLGVQF